MSENSIIRDRRVFGPDIRIVLGAREQGRPSVRLRQLVCWSSCFFSKAVWSRQDFRLPAGTLSRSLRHGLGHLVDRNPAFGLTGRAQARSAPSAAWRRGRLSACRFPSGPASQPVCRAEFLKTAFNAKWRRTQFCRSMLRMRVSRRSHVALVAAISRIGKGHDVIGALPVRRIQHQLPRRRANVKARAMLPTM